GSPISTNDTLYNKTAGTYYVLVNDSLNCAQIDSVTITEPSTALSISTVAQITKPTCNGGSNGSARVVAGGGTPYQIGSPYKYVWSKTKALADTLPSSNNDTVTGLTARKYYVEVKDSLGCTDLDSVTIIEPTAVNVKSVDLINALKCNGDANGSALVVGEGGTPYIASDAYRFVWSKTKSLADTVSQNDTATGLSSRKYYVQVKDSLGCTDIDSINLSQPNAIDINLIAQINPVTCYGGSNGKARIMATGGTTYKASEPYRYYWSTNRNFVPDTLVRNDTASGLSAIKYYAQAKDSLGCSDIDSITITQPAAALNIDTLIVHTSVPCGGGLIGKASVRVSGGWRKASAPYYAYVWSASPTFTGDTLSRIDTLSGVSSGVYYVKVIDSLGCEVDSSKTIPVLECPPQPVVGPVFCTKSQGYFGTDNPGKATYYNGFNSDGSTLNTCTNVQTATRGTLKNALRWWNERAASPTKDSFVIGNVNLSRLTLDQAVQEILDYLPGGGPIGVPYTVDTLPPAYDPAGK
ncbi:MAG: SprB repeat-containing protein, partial [Chitinophagaceae bacterium]